MPRLWVVVTDPRQRLSNPPLWQTRFKRLPGAPSSQSERTSLVKAALPPSRRSMTMSRSLAAADLRHRLRATAAFRLYAIIPVAGSSCFAFIVLWAGLHLKPPSTPRLSSPAKSPPGHRGAASLNRRRVTAERLAKSPPDVLLPSLLRYMQSGRSDPSPAGPTLLCLSGKLPWPLSGRRRYLQSKSRWFTIASTSLPLHQGYLHGRSNYSCCRRFF